MLGWVLAIVVAVHNSFVLVLPVDEVEIVLAIAAGLDRSVHPILYVLFITQLKPNNQVLSTKCRESLISLFAEGSLEQFVRGGL